MAGENTTIDAPITRAEGLFCIVRSRGACERLEEALSERWFYEYNPRETNEENSKSHDDYSCK